MTHPLLFGVDYTPLLTLPSVPRQVDAHRLADEPSDRSSASTFKTQPLAQLLNPFPASQSTPLDRFSITRNTPYLSFCTRATKGLRLLIITAVPLSHRASENAWEPGLSDSVGVLDWTRKRSLPSHLSDHRIALPPSMASGSFPHHRCRSPESLSSNELARDHGLVALIRH